MLNEAYKMGCVKALQDMEKEAWWRAPLLGAMTNVAYDQTLNQEHPHSLLDSALRGSLIGTGASLGWRLPQHSKFLGATLGGTLGYMGGKAVSREMPEGPAQ